MVAMIMIFMEGYFLSFSFFHFFCRLLFLFSFFFLYFFLFSFYGFSFFGFALDCYYSINFWVGDVAGVCWKRDVAWLLLVLCVSLFHLRGWFVLEEKWWFVDSICVSSCYHHITFFISILFSYIIGHNI